MYEKCIKERENKSMETTTASEKNILLKVKHSVVSGIHVSGIRIATV